MDHTASTIKPESPALLYVQSTDVAESTAGVLELLRRHATGEGLRVCGEFVDALQLGGAPRRPGFEALLAEVRRGAIGAGVVVCRSIGVEAIVAKRGFAIVASAG